MSLVNDMLRDLDARRGELPVGGTLNGIDPAPIENARPAYAHWLLLPLLGAIVAVAGWFWVSSKPQPVPQPVVTPAPVIVAPEPVSSAPVAAAPEQQTKEQPVITEPEQPLAKPAPETIKPEPVATAEPEIAAEPKPAIQKKPRPLSPAEQAELKFADAMAAYRTGDMRRVEILLQETLNLAPDHVRARDQLAQLLIMQQRHQEAERTLREGLAIDAGQVTQAQLLGQMLAQQDREQEAIAVMEPALLQGASNPNFLGTLAGVYQNAGEPQRAIDNYRAALSLRPQQSLWWMGLGISLEQTGQYPAAIKAYQQALQRTQLSAELRQYVQQRLAVLNPTPESNP